MFQITNINVTPRNVSFYMIVITWNDVSSQLFGYNSESTGLSSFSSLYK